MYIQVNGLVVGENSVGDSDKRITLLTDKNGLINVLVKGAKFIRNRNSCVSQLLSYSHLTLYKGKNGYIINEAEIKELFIGLRNDINKLCLAQYFCEVVSILAPKDENAIDYLRLVLNCLSYLEKGKRSNQFLKSVFEMRLCAMAGYMPDLVGCHKCGVYKSGFMYFCLENSFLMCKNCLNRDFKNQIHLISCVSEALRYIVYSPMEKLFSFKISDDALDNLAEITEKYLIFNSYSKFKTLDFYKSISK